MLLSLFVPDVTQGNEGAGCVQDFAGDQENYVEGLRFPCATSVFQHLSSDFTQAIAND